MQTRHTDAIPLAPQPNLEQYKKLAKDLVKAAAGEVDSVREWVAAWIERLARLSVAAEVTRDLDGIIQDLEQSRLLASDRVPAKATLSEAQLVIARLHGFESWPKFVKHIEKYQEPSSPVSQFETAADAIVTGDVSTLKTLLRNNPQLVRARSTRDHHATLLHYVGANGHEGFRQRTPGNAVEIARVLLEAGAEPDARANMYGHGCTTMEMLVSSEHPHAAGVQSALVELLLDFGAAVDGVKGDGSPLMTAFRFHYPKAAETLARRGAKVDNVISAAALGRVRE
ncbi:MAG: hypothetical protein ACRENP_10195 [Longimicrobiales bacterium]